MFSLLVLAIPIVIAIWIGKALAAGLSDEKRKILGGVALLVGVLLAIYGVNRINSVNSQFMGARGNVDIGGWAAIDFGVFAGLIGIVVLVSKGSPNKANQVSSTRKCPYCAETIQAEAKICRFCNRSLETASSNL